MSFGDPDYKPNKAAKRQQIRQDSEMIRLCFKMKCKTCNRKLVKSSYYVKKPVDPRIMQVYNDFYSIDHYCSDCSPEIQEGPAPALEEFGAFRYRGRAG